MMTEEKEWTISSSKRNYAQSGNGLSYRKAEYTCRYEEVDGQMEGFSIVFILLVKYKQGRQLREESEKEVDM